MSDVSMKTIAITRCDGMTMLYSKGADPDDAVQMLIRVLAGIEGVDEHALRNAIKALPRATQREPRPGAVRVDGVETVQ